MLQLSLLCSFTQAIHPKGSARGLYIRKNNDSSFADSSSTRDRNRLRLDLLNYYKSLYDLSGTFLKYFATSSPQNHFQWHWLCEGCDVCLGMRSCNEGCSTPDRSLDQVVDMLLGGAFLVGLTEHFDESLMLWRHFMGLFVEDILFNNRKTVCLGQPSVGVPDGHCLWRQGFAHPAVSDWHPDEQSAIKLLAEQTGDMRYYKMARLVFERQVEAYGGWGKLTAETSKFRAVRAHVEKECEGTLEQNQGYMMTHTAASFELTSLLTRFQQASNSPARSCAWLPSTAVRAWLRSSTSSDRSASL